MATPSDSEVLAQEFALLVGTTFRFVVTVVKVLAHKIKGR